MDGSLGMAYGVTSTTLLLTIGMAPALASASVHMAEIGTTLMAGLSHSRFGNVDWRAVGLMTFPGAGGAFLGAVVLSSLDGELAKPWVAGILAGLGLYVLWRFLGRRQMRRTLNRPLSARFLLPLGLSAGFIDAVGGGGWGPVGTPTLLASGRLEPRKVVGTVDTGEFLVALGASLGFLLSLSWSEIPLQTVGALLAGGAVAAPLAAYLVRAISPRKLGVLAGAAILLTNAGTLALSLGIGGSLRVVLYGAILLVLSGLAGWRLWQVRGPRLAARLAGQ
ncbi:MAG: sulfite exporter TauE/SafE family protein [Acidimicrobiia bacterium]